MTEMIWLQAWPGIYLASAGTLIIIVITLHGYNKQFLWCNDGVEKLWPCSCYTCLSTNARAENLAYDCTCGRTLSCQQMNKSEV